MEINFNFSNKRALVGVIILICVLAVGFYLPGILDRLAPAQCTVDGVCQHEQYANFLTEIIPVFILIGVVIGAVVFFIMSSRLEKKEKGFESVIATFLKFLGKDERLVVQKIIENDGKVLQAEISRIEGIGKLKAHRIVQRLVDRGVVEVEHFGKTNIIKLPKEISALLVVKK